jgi:ADP-heptose:LPS heptosyltransferase
MDRPSSVLIVLLGAIGDVARGVSVAVRLKRAWPEVRLTWAVEPASRALVQGHRCIDRVVLFERHRGLAGYRDFIAALRREPYDVVLDMQRHFKSGMTSWLSRGRRRIGFHRKNAKEGNWLFNNGHIPPVENFSPKILQYQKFGDALGLPALEPLEFGFEADEQAEQKIAALLGDNGTRGRCYAALLTGSSWPSRFWRAEHYRVLIDELFCRYGLVSVLIGGKNEEAFCTELCTGLAEERVVNLAGKTSLSELFALFPKMKLAIGSDCGPMHIAAAMGLKVISLWGSTSPLRSAPYGSERLILQSTIGCSPCYRKRCPGLMTLCMSDIPPAAVLARAVELFGKEYGEGGPETVRD